MTPIEEYSVHGNDEEAQLLITEELEYSENECGLNGIDCRPFA